MILLPLLASLKRFISNIATTMIDTVKTVEKLSVNKGIVSTDYFFVDGTIIDSVFVILFLPLLTLEI